MNELLLQFIRNHQRLFIYGNTEKHKILKKYLESYNCEIENFVTSDFQDYSSSDVVNINSMCAEDGVIGIIISVQDRYYNEIIPNLLHKEFKAEDLYFLPVAERDTICVEFTKKEIIEANDIREIKNAYYQYCERIIRLCNNNFYYMYCVHYDLGDLVQAFQLRGKFERKYKARLIFFINENQKVIADICRIQSYVVVDKLRVDNKGLIDRQMMELNIQMFESFFANVPIKGVPFVIPFMINFRNMLKEGRFSDHFTEWLALDNEKIKCPDIIDVSDSLKNKLRNIKPNEVVLMAPEATSMQPPKLVFWDEIVNQALKEGYTVITNALDEKNIIPHTLDLKLSLRELLELAGNCRKVYSMRSGLCDCIAGRKGEWYVYYWSENSIEYFGIKTNFLNCGDYVNERLINTVYR